MYTEHQCTLYYVRFIVKCYTKLIFKTTNFVDPPLVSKIETYVAQGRPEIHLSLKMRFGIKRNQGG